MGIVNVKETIYYLECKTAKIKLVNQEYPNFKLKYDKYSDTYEYFSPKVKTSFNNIEIIQNTYYLSMELSRKLDFVFDGKSEVIIVHNCPLQYQLGTIDRKTNSFIFYEKPFTCRDKLLKKKVQDVIDKAILGYIKSNPRVHLNKNQLSPRLQKLLVLI